MLKKLAALCSATSLALVLLPGCAGTVEPSAYAGEQPKLDMQKYFNGRLDAWGMFQDRSGKVIKRFIVVIDCKWDGDNGTLDEHFSYSDGTKQERIWKLHRNGTDQVIGTAGDVVGEAIGTIGGNALHWQYVLAVPVDGKVINFDFDDWMFQMDDHVMLNRTVMSKFGFKAGEVTLSFTKP